MSEDAIALAKKIKIQFEYCQKQRQYSQIAKLITYALQVIPSNYNQQIFGYIPNLFSQVELDLSNPIQPDDLFIGEPVVYKIYYPAQQKLYDIPYFYIFCYLQENSQQLNVYFQSAHPGSKNLSPDQYHLNQSTINFEGCLSAFNPHKLSVISISDPGHFIPGLTSSYYAGSAELNFTKLIAQVLEQICNLAKINLNNTMLFGSSAGSFGALLSSTYLPQKTNVLAVNSQIYLQNRNYLMKSLLGINQPQQLLKKFGNQIDCNYRFKQDLKSIPNIYILANINDHLHQRNFDFYQLYLSRFTHKGVDNQSVFDSYYGVEGHGRPETTSLKAKIDIARKILTMKSTIQ
ncbi:MAG: hypothetical protein ACFCU7_00150 [Pleurocapsa sp.]